MAVAVGDGVGVGDGTAEDVGVGLGLGVGLDCEINWTLKPTPGPEENFGAPTASARYFQGFGSGSLSFSFRN